MSDEWKAMDKCKKCGGARVIMELADDCSLGLRCKDCGAFSSTEPEGAMTEADIEAGRSAKGGFTRQQLKEWGVPWPPPKGWKKALMCGKDPANLESKADPAKLLRKVVLAIIESGNFEIIKDMNDVHAFFNCKPYDEAMKAIAEQRKHLRNDAGDDVPWFN